MSSDRLRIELLTSLKTQLVEFFDELIELFPDEQDFIVGRILINDTLPISIIMDYIVKNLCPLQEQVKTKNEDFFLQNNILFEKLDSEKASKVNHFRRIWTSGLDHEDKETIWKWFTSFIFLGNKYKDISKK
jgi:hypothetical protein